MGEHCTKELRKDRLESIIVVKLKEFAVSQLLAHAALLLVKGSCVEGARGRHNDEAVGLGPKPHDAAHILWQPVLRK